MNEVLRRLDGQRPADVVTFGCRLNAHESDQVEALAKAQGLADAVIFNTCAVTSEAVRQARQAIRRARRDRPSAKLIVTGCAAQIDPDAFAGMAEVDLVLGNREKAAPSSYASSAFLNRVQVGDIMGPSRPPPAAAGGPPLVGASWAPAPPAHRRARAYVEVQNGCDHRCTFCVIPFGRGNSRSTDAEIVVGRVQALADQGVNEVVLTGVDLTAWGQDLVGAPTLGALVSQILRDAPTLPRLRLSSIDAAEIDGELLERLSDAPRLMPHLHLSLQAGDDMILKRMKRRHTRADALRLIQTVRSVRPDVAFGADLIAGFPTEDEAMFDHTLQLIAEAGLAYAHIFPFSPRPETPAARMPQIERSVIKSRAERLRAAAAVARSLHLQKQVGREVWAIVETEGRARAEDFTEVGFEGSGAPGTLVRLAITGHDQRIAEGRLIAA